MFRQNIINSLRPVARSNNTNFLPITAVRAMSEGATGSGASRAGGEAAGDAYTRREKAQEDFYVKQKEREKLLSLKAKLQQQREHLDELDKHIDELTREQGGEQN
ncbi:MAG: hypothetical protein M1819_002365 [Sarea resinae]|nr:MAG: hypothetical protein M1819_002365 [Sarea resinae]